MLKKLLSKLTLKPHFTIPGYMRRWYLIPKNNFFNIRLHRIHGCDPHGFYHDHPSWNVSLLLRGGYVEEAPEEGIITDSITTFSAPTLIFRKATSLHVIRSYTPTWSLFISGPTSNDWGFVINGEKVPARLALDPATGNIRDEYLYKCTTCCDEGVYTTMVGYPNGSSEQTVYCPDCTDGPLAGRAVND